MHDVYAMDDVKAALNDLDWENPAALGTNSPFDPVLFRGHDNLDPLQTGDYGSGPPLIHATPVLSVAASHWKFKLSRLYHNFPATMGFVTVYPCAADQRFYPDEHLEAVRRGTLADHGVALPDIAAFDARDHFETALDPQAQPLATYLFRHDGLGRNLQVAPLAEDSPVRAMLIANQKPPRSPAAGLTPAAPGLRP